ncbi:MAG: hypothetical protein ABI298_03355 [Acidimicrobiales bacterium]
MQSSGNGITSLVVIVAMVFISTETRKGRRNSSNVTLVKRERLRPLSITLVDPLISLVLIGQIFWNLASSDIGHVVCALLGAPFGVAIGWARARVMYVRAIPEIKSVILRRSGTEYALLALLLGLRLAEDSVTANRSGFASYALTALISLAVVEAFARTGFIVQKYLNKKNGTSEYLPPPPQESNS